MLTTWIQAVCGGVHSRRCRGAGRIVAVPAVVDRHVHSAHGRRLRS